MKENKQITLGSSDSTTAADFTYSMKGKVISIVLGRGLDPRRDSENTAEDRALAPGPCYALQDSVPGR
jgi:hypothetical protein